MAKIGYSVVLPAHNEAPRLENAVSKLSLVLSRFAKGKGFEIIIAEDGSKDDTFEVAKKIALKNKSVRVFHDDKKLGRGKALSLAFLKATGDVVAYMDVDLATDVSHVEELLSRVDKGADVVTGSRYLQSSKAKRSSNRLVLSGGYNFFVRFLLGSTLYDHQCGFKAFKKSVALKLCKEAKSRKWFWDTEVLVLAQKKGLRVEEFPIKWDEQRTTTVNFKTDVVEMGAAVLELWWRTLF